MDALRYRVDDVGVLGASDIMSSTASSPVAVAVAALLNESPRPVQLDAVNATATTAAAACPSTHVPSLPVYFAGG